MVHDSIVSCIGKTPLVHLRRLFPFQGLSVIAKLELLNPGGSVKDRPARFIVEEGLKAGTINARTPLVESSSGNLGIALAMVARAYGLSFTCVVDPKISPANLRILRSLGAEVDTVRELDEQGGYLGTRIRRVREIVKSAPGTVWINQYANQLNWRAHYEGEGEEIVRDLGAPVDTLVVAVSTTGTILGLARRLRERNPRLRVVAVDAAGSVIFGSPPQRRELPGMGASRVPELLCRAEIDEVVHVDDRESVSGCRALAAHEGIFAGGSSGAVVAALRKLVPRLPRPSVVLTVLPDRGDRYLDMVYNDAWVDRLGGLDGELRPVFARARWRAPAAGAVVAHGGALHE
jgi:N-(2-amino-2-carboxyethyl)-L-glutamate synthase